MALYYGSCQQSPPDDHIRKIADSGSKPEPLSQPDFGIDSPMGLAASFFAAPIYLYATKKGKFQVWDKILGDIPDSSFKGPALDVGCGRGMVLLKVAQRKKKLLSSGGSALQSDMPPAYGIDIFVTADQAGNSPLATYKNAAAMDVVPHVVLHTASFTERLPFGDDVFSLITSNLALHNAKREGRSVAMREISRVCAPGGRVVIVDLFGHLKGLAAVLEELGWEGVDVSMVGLKMLYGTWPCQILTAVKASRGED